MRIKRKFCKKNRQKISVALKKCEKAWAEHPEAKYAWCQHLGQEVSPIQEKASWWIDNCIMQHYSLHGVVGKIVAWLENFRPAYGEFENVSRTYHETFAAAKQAHIDAQAKLREAYKKKEILYDEFSKKRVLITEEKERVYREANKIYKATWATLHRQQVPHHTWDDKKESFFK